MDRAVRKDPFERPETERLCRAAFERSDQLPEQFDGVGALPLQQQWRRSVIFAPVLERLLAT
jgi:hypothetical protein